MRLERQYLIDIIEAADAIAAFLSGQDKQSFLDNDLVRSAVLHKITVIGEAAGKVTPGVPTAIFRGSVGGHRSVSKHRGSRVLQRRVVHCMGRRDQGDGRAKKQDRYHPDG